MQEEQEPVIEQETVMAGWIMEGQAFRWPRNSTPPPSITPEDVMVVVSNAPTMLCRIIFGPGRGRTVAISARNKVEKLEDYLIPDLTSMGEPAL